ncbi:hypothetical protein EH243_03255 [Amphritea opalescens]|uniref:SPOR domain-containing protein n=1 Tax=Amphritea opalescens TaxID=2490544 RepID=A0A430KUT9_9GAMM|nr:SPOR domain-containing protein [Amphritea opalescens]RTE67236.1 hypothetical protein EH243_03255 [Amphritea opalescens]
MARKDFAKKRNSGSAASRTTRSSAKSKSAPIKKPFPWVRSFISLLFLVGFGYTLWQLTSVKPDSSATTTSAKPSTQSPAPSTKPVAKAVKPKPTQKAPTNSSSSSQNPALPVEEQSERFGFYEILPDSEVDTANVKPYKSTPKSAKSKHTYVLQAGSFQSSKDADQLRARLILEGLPSVRTKRVTNSNGSIWYQVLAGPFENRSMLSKAEDRLVRMNIQPLVRQID